MTVSFRVPSSKSMSHRMLIGAALASGESTVQHLLDCDDVYRTRTILQQAGADIHSQCEGVWRVAGMQRPQGGSAEEPVSCDVHESGTTCRLLAAVLAAGKGCFRVHGVERMHERPIGELVTVLRELGANIHSPREGYPPLEITANGLQGGEVTLPLNASSQYLSGLLLAAPLCRAPLWIRLTGENKVSWPYVGLTLQVLELFGHQVSSQRLQDDAWVTVPWRDLSAATQEDVRLTVVPKPYQAGAYTVEGDWSAASYLLGAGAVGRQPVCVQGLRGDSLQGDREFLEILRRMGAVVKEDAAGITVVPSSLHGLSVDMNACPDIVPTVAVLAAYASGETHIHHVAHLRLKESDRLHAMRVELERFGVAVTEEDDGLRICGCGGVPPTVPVDEVCTHNDHRIAMSLALLGLHGTPIQVDDPSVVQKSFPHFWTLWDGLLCEQGTL